MSKRVIKPTSVIDWSASVVAGAPGVGAQTENVAPGTLPRQSRGAPWPCGEKGARPPEPSRLSPSLASLPVPRGRVIATVKISLSSLAAVAPLFVPLDQSTFGGSGVCGRIDLTLRLGRLRRARQTHDHAAIEHRHPPADHTRGRPVRGHRQPRSAEPDRRPASAPGGDRRPPGTDGDDPGTRRARRRDPQLRGADEPGSAARPARRLPRGSGSWPWPTTPRRPNAGR